MKGANEVDFYFINHNGQKIDLSEAPYLFQEGDLLDWVYAYQTMQNNGRNRTTDYHQEVKEFAVKVAVVPDFSLEPEARKAQWKEDVNNFYDVTIQDVIDGINGALWTDTGYYLPCKLIGSSKSDWRMGLPFMFNDVTLLADNPAWIKDYKRSFYASGSSSGGSGIDFLAYPYSYSYTYSPPEAGYSNWEIDNYGDNDFEMIVYGPCENPRVVINGQPYEVYETLEANEYIVITSNPNAVVKHLANGTTVDLWDYRLKTSSIFEPIPSGELDINWSGEFGFDLTIYAERSEPAW